MVFCNYRQRVVTKEDKNSHNPYFNRWFSAIPKFTMQKKYGIVVTILILIDGFLQFRCIQRNRGAK